MFSFSYFSLSSRWPYSFPVYGWSCVGIKLRLAIHVHGLCLFVYILRPLSSVARTTNTVPPIGHPCILLFLSLSTQQCVCGTASGLEPESTGSINRIESCTDNCLCFSVQNSIRLICFGIQKNGNHISMYAIFQSFALEDGARQYVIAIFATWAGFEPASWAT